MSKWAKKIIIVVAYPDRGAGNDSKPLGLAFPTKAQHYYIGKYGSNDLLSQGGLLSLSAYSL